MCMFRVLGVKNSIFNSRFFSLPINYVGVRWADACWATLSRLPGSRRWAGATTPPNRCCFQAKREQLEDWCLATKDIICPSQGHDLALTALYVPCSLDSGRVLGSYLRLIDVCITQL